MARVFISGYVSESALRSAVRGAVVRASVIGGRDGHDVWHGATDDAGAFGFELDVDEHPLARCLSIELHLGGASAARKEVAWDDVAAAGAHVDFLVEAPGPQPAGEPPPWPFPINFPGVLPPQLERPADVPAHPMAALPFLIQRSYPRDPEEEESGADELVAAAATGAAEDPP
jgi:hypothetical protein